MSIYTCIYNIYIYNGDIACYIEKMKYLDTHESCIQTTHTIKKMKSVPDAYFYWPQHFHFFCVKRVKIDERLLFLDMTYHSVPPLKNALLDFFFISQTAIFLFISHDYA